MAFISKALATSPTKEDAENKNIEENRGQMGALLLSKNEGSQSSGSIVKMSSNLFPKCEFCLLTSNLVPAGVDIRMEDYHIEFWKSDLSKIKTLQLPTIVEQPTQCYRSAAGLVLIPVRRPSKKASIFDNRRTFDTDYYNKESEESKGGNDILHCYIMGKKYSITFTGQPFTLINKKDNQGQVLYQLQHGDGSVFSTYKDIKSHFSYLCPHGGAILKGKGKDTVCIGVLNFTDEVLISPVFFTKENLTAAVQFFNPSRDIKQQVSGKAIENPGGRTFTQVDASPTRTGMDSTTKAREKSSEEMKQKDLHVEETCLLENVTAHGYKIRAVNIPSDGNCLFHAVEDQLVKVLGLPGHTHESLRALAVHKLKCNEVDNHLSMDLAAVVLGSDTTTTYLQKMGCDGTWGGHPELVALSNALGRSIKVVTSSSSAAVNSIGNFDVPPILLGHLSKHQHYKSLELKQVQDSSVHIRLASSMTATPGATTPLFEPYSLVTGHQKKSTFAQRQAIMPERNISFSNGNPTPNDDIISNGDDRQQLLPKDDLQNPRLLTAKDMLNGTLNLLTKSSELDREFDCEEIRRLKEQVSQVNHDRSRLRGEISQLRFDLRTIGERFSEEAQSHLKEYQRLKEIISQLFRENAELRDHVRRVEKENEELRAEKNELLAKNKELHAEKQNKWLISPKTSAVLGDDSSSSTGSNNVQAGEPCRLSTNSSQGDSDGSSEEEPFVDALTEPAALTLDNN